MGEDFAVQHKDSEYLGELEEELQTAVLEAIPVEKRLRGLPPEERLRGLSPEEVLRRFTPEELAAGLSEEQAARLRELLERVEHLTVKGELDAGHLDDFGVLRGKSRGFEVEGHQRGRG